MEHIYKNFIAGAVQGTLTVATGHPFDLVKARMQSGQYSSTYRCVAHTLKREGIFGFYRGSLANLSLYLFKRPLEYPLAELLKQRTKNNYLTGAGTGIFSAVIGTPLQVVKVGMQTSTKMSTLEYLRRHMKNRIYRGFGPTLFRDSFFTASFIGHYYTMRDWFAGKGYNLTYSAFISGVTANCLTWSILFPLDTVKTRVQKVHESRDVITVVTSLYRTSGIRGFWVGVGPMIFRTVPVSGSAMIGYEWTRKLLEN